MRRSRVLHLHIHLSKLAALYSELDDVNWLVGKTVFYWVQPYQNARHYILHASLPSVY